MRTESARVDTLAVVAEGGVSLEGVRAQPMLTPSGPRSNWSAVPALPGRRGAAQEDGVRRATRAS
ncbi:DUF6214 family protein [Streptomyces canus]|uniref:DUF6214 family protein n=1 Tax=Streptomyces canus TaxID=58343 RepID=UPI0033BB79B9